MDCGAVFEGGGVKGIGLAGAAGEFAKAGYSFTETAGTSAGAIVSSLIAAGYPPEELYDIMMNMDFKQFRGESNYTKFGAIGKAIRATKKFGIYHTEFLEEWLSGLLKEKGVEKFGDLKHDLSVIASDLTRQRMMVLPRDLKRLGMKPEDFSVAAAARMSMSIPMYFDPYKLQTKRTLHYVVDGGLLSNFPMWLLDKHTCDMPVFGFRFMRDEEEGEDKGIKSLLDFVMSIADTCLDGHDRYYEARTKGDSERTVIISATVEIDGKKKELSATDFGLSEEEKQGLYDNGANAAKKFLETWDYEAWRAEFCK